MSAEEASYRIRMLDAWRWKSGEDREEPSRNSSFTAAA